MIRHLGLIITLLMLGRTACAEDWWTQILGNYQGPVLNAGRIQQLSTQFSLDDTGKLIGHYYVEDDPPFEGDLSDFHADGPSSGTFVWHDRFGEGHVHVSFDPELGRFAGSWGDDQPQQSYIFDGYRIRPPAGS